MSAKKKTSAQKSAPKATPSKKASAPKKAHGKSAAKADKKPVPKKAAAKADKKAPAQKASAKKPPAKKAAVKKVVSKKAPSAGKATPAKKKAAPAKKKAAPAKKKAAPAKKEAPRKTPAKKAAKKPSGKAAAEKPAAQQTADEAPKGIATEEVTRRVTQALAKRGAKGEEDESRKGQPVVFSLKDLRDFLKKRKSAPPEEVDPPPPAVKKAAKETAPAKPVEEKAPARPKQSFGAASVADLLGFDPTASTGASPTSKSSEEGVPKKLLPYYRSLVRLHEEVLAGLNRHSEETLRRSNKEDSGDLSSYGQHMADAGTDSFDRDFALSMVSSEQEALYEIDEAIRRIRDGSYGVCQITGKPISRDRLRAVPFTRYSVEGQMEVEKGRRRVVQKAGIQGFDGDDSPVLSDEDSDE